MQEELLKLMQTKQELTMKYTIVNMFIFLIGITLLFQLAKGNVWENFKIELPFIGSSISTIAFYIIFSLIVSVYFMEYRKKLGLV